MNPQASALRFFFTIALGRADLAHQLARTHYPRKLPRVLAREQVARLIEAAPGPGLKYKTALSIAGACPRAGQRPDPWGAGLRGGEVVMLRVGDIDSKRMLICVELGKGRKSLPSRKRGIGMPCCRRSFCRCCAHGGCSAGREAGYSRVRTRGGQ